MYVPLSRFFKTTRTSLTIAPNIDLHVFKVLKCCRYRVESLLYNSRRQPHDVSCSESLHERTLGFSGLKPPQKVDRTSVFRVAIGSRKSNRSRSCVRCPLGSIYCGQIVAKLIQRTRIEIMVFPNGGLSKLWSLFGSPKLGP